MVVFFEQRGRGTGGWYHGAVQCQVVVDALFPAGNGGVARQALQGESRWLLVEDGVPCLVGGQALGDAGHHGVG